VAPLGVEVGHVGSQRLGDARTVEAEEKDHGERPGRVGLGGMNEGGQLVTVEARDTVSVPTLGRRMADTELREMASSSTAYR
jgi:hypothetical protein